mmetsp:Transcript_37741/g.97621  ORF Transcript_37741/g.97621 Transcript_37741/m.97621 type:complete len:91 (-) Transcript_37741:345-617(-)
MGAHPLDTTRYTCETEATPFKKMAGSGFWFMHEATRDTRRQCLRIFCTKQGPTMVRRMRRSVIAMKMMSSTLEHVSLQNGRSVESLDTSA